MQRQRRPDADSLWRAFGSTRSFSGIGTGRDEVIFAAELLAAYDKMIDVAQVTALLQRVGETADAEQVRMVLDELAAEQPPRLIRTTAAHVRDDGSRQLLSYFVLPTPFDGEHP